MGILHLKQSGVGGWMPCLNRSKEEKGEEPFDGKEGWSSAY